MANLVPKDASGEELFGRLINNFWQDSQLNVDIKEFDDRYEVKADLPGFKKEEIHVEYDRDILLISAKHEKTDETKDENGRYLRRERSTSSYQRQFTIKNVNEDKISASFNDGVLQLDLPKTEPGKEMRKKIEVK
ncbi:MULTISPECIES: Hsp20/alpha crystallin family protein [unclassified Enterococcus]|jgi:HSP20 family protein|uniref:Hsp20/alpha crystallin family protein n=1 Tax=unclassified Enterococcus TaxID=2608891 RepID=UPI0003540F9F|nr:Hsp20/alpha crystallin family protein [Enterococcus faecalis 13-SD-W-01]